MLAEAFERFLDRERDGRYCSCEQVVHMTGYISKHEMIPDVDCQIHGQSFRQRKKALDKKNRRKEARDDGESGADS